MNPLFMNQPMGPGGDISASPYSGPQMAPQTAPMQVPTPMMPPPAMAQQAGTPLIPLNPQAVPNSMIAPQGNVAQQLRPVGPMQAPAPSQGVPNLGLRATPAMRAPAQPAPQAVVAQDKQSTAMYDALNSDAAKPYLAAFSNAGFDTNALRTSAQETKDAIAARIPTLNYVQRQGTEAAVRSAFQGGDYMDLASNMLGKTEGKDHAVLADVFKKQMGTSIDPRQTPWCAAFVGSVLASGGVKGTGSLSARSYLKWGEPVGKTEGSRGDVAVFGRGNNPNLGHVAFIDHYSDDGKTVYVLGGNQGDAVTISARPTSSLLGVRRPPKAEELQNNIQKKTLASNVDSAPKRLDEVNPRLKSEQYSNMPSVSPNDDSQMPVYDNMPSGTPTGAPRSLFT